MNTRSNWSRAARAASLITAMCLLAACDALVPTAERPEGGRDDAPALRLVAPSGSQTGSVAAHTRGAARFDLGFLPPEVRPGGALTAVLQDRSGEPVVALRSREAHGSHELSLGFGAAGARPTVIEARLAGRVVASSDAVSRTGGVGGAASLREPTSVHYFWYEGRDGQWVLGVEYDYDLHGGTVVNLVGTASPVRADRVRFVVTGFGPESAPQAIRVDGFERLLLTGGARIE